MDENIMNILNKMKGKTIKYVAPLVKNDETIYGIFIGTEENKKDYIFEFDNGILIVKEE